MVWHARVCAGSGDDSDDDGDDDGGDDDDDDDDDDDYDHDGGGDGDDAGDDDDDDRAGDDGDACLSCDTLIVIPLIADTLALEKPYVPPTPKSCFSHPEAIPGWRATASSTYISCPRLIPPRSQPLVPQGRIWLEA